jgi:hypothetical protein
MEGRKHRIASDPLAARPLTMTPRLRPVSPIAFGLSFGILAAFDIGRGSTLGFSLPMVAGLDRAVT